MNTTSDAVSFSAVYDLVNENWEFKPENYSQVIGDSIDDRVNFETRHVLLHVSKIAGDIVKANSELAAVVEDTEHSGNFLGNRIRQAPKQLIINGLKLAYTLGVSPEELLRQLMEWAAKQNQEQEG
ncbi:hypothetical protein IPM19_00865 [bacterium]|nr:MAG: hypothetical protein IPM19_00865 [bacterium]